MAASRTFACRALFVGKPALDMFEFLRAHWYRLLLLGNFVRGYRQDGIVIDLLINHDDESAHRDSVQKRTVDLNCG